MSKVPTLRVVSKDRASQLPDLTDEVRLALNEAALSAREGLLAMSVATGLRVMLAMMQAEITGLAGPKGKHHPGRAAVRHGNAPTSVTLGAAAGAGHPAAGPHRERRGGRLRPPPRRRHGRRCPAGSCGPPRPRSPNSSPVTCPS